MVVARDRYVAEDAAGAIVVELRAAPGRRRHRGRRRPAPRSCTRDRADNVVGARRRGARRRRRRAAPPRRTSSSGASRSSAAPPRRSRAAASSRASTRRAGCSCYDATQAPTGIRNGLSRLFDLDARPRPRRRARRRRRLRRQGHPVLSRGGPGPARGPPARDAGQVDRGPARALHRLHARAQAGPPRPGGGERRRPDPRARDELPARQRRLLPVRADHPDHHARRSSRARTGSTTTATTSRPCSRTGSPTSPYRGAGRPHARVRDGARSWTALAIELGLDRAEIRRRNFIRPDEFPYDVGVTFQDGGPTVYDSGDYPAGLDAAARGDRLRRLRGAPRGGPRRGAALGLGIGCYVEGTGIGPYEGAAIDVQVRRHRDGGDRPVEPGPGPPDDPRPDRRRRARRADRAHPVTTGDTRRLGCGVGHVREPHRGRLRQRGAQGGGRRCAGRPPSWPPGILEVDPGGPRVRRRRGRRRRLARARARARPARRDGEPAALRVRRGVGARPRCSPGACTRRRTSRSRTGRRPGLNAVEYYSPTSGVFGFGMHAAVVEIDAATCDVRILDYVVRPRLRAHHQPDRSSRGRCTAASRRGSAARCTSGWPTTTRASC